MKTLIAAACLAAVALPGAALAETTYDVSFGYASVKDNNTTLGALQGRFGARFTPNFGLEAELAGGIKDDRINLGLTSPKIRLTSAAAAYVVGDFPVTKQIDLMARVGVGTTTLAGPSAATSVAPHGNSVNYGAAAQYSFDDKNGVRGDYTRYHFDKRDEDVWAIAYVRKF